MIIQIHLTIAINSKISWRFSTKYMTFFKNSKRVTLSLILKFVEKSFDCCSPSSNLLHICQDSLRKRKNLYSNWFSKHLFVHFSKSLEDRIMASSAEKTNGTESKPPLASLASWVRLNVGGTVFATTVTTLAKDPDSFLYRICRTDDKDYLDSHKVNS